MDLRRKRLGLVLGVLAVAGGGALVATGMGEALARRAKGWIVHHEPAGMSWTRVDPAAAGLDPEALESMRRELESWGTHAFLVVRGDRIAYEWYSPRTGPNTPLPTTATAKALTGSVALAVALDEGTVALDDRVAAHIPEWRAPPRSRITIGHLAFHYSGLEDVDFGRGARDELEGWQQRYYDRRGDRFRLAIEEADLVFEPGTGHSYSGVGYYVLAYALAAASRSRTPAYDVRTILRDRVMEPLGVPDDGWTISYGESYGVDGMTLRAIGSGGLYTARAAAAVAQLFLSGGDWRGQQILDGSVVRALLSPPGLGDPDDTIAFQGVPGAGWYPNIEKSWPSLPADAFCALGSNHQVVLAVPSWDLVAVRFGSGPLGGRDAAFDEALTHHFFEPLARAVGASSAGSAGDRADLLGEDARVLADEPEVGAEQ